MQRILVVSVVGLVVAASLSFSVINAMNYRDMAEKVDRLEKELAEKPSSPEATPRANVETDFNEDVELPLVERSAWLDPMSSVIGDVEIGHRVYVGPFASVRGDEGQPIHIGDESNIQDGVVVHALETQSHGRNLDGRTYNVGGRAYAVYVGERVSLAHQALVHGPARVDDDVFIGMQAMVFKARIGSGSVVEPGAKVIGVTVPPGRYVPAGRTLTSQAEADALPTITESYPFKDLNEAVVHVNTSFADGYGGKPTGHGSKKKSSKKKSSHDEEEEVVAEEHGEEEEEAPRKKSSRMAAEDEEAVEEEEEAPRKKSSRASEEEEEEAPRKRSSRSEEEVEEPVEEEAPPRRKRSSRSEDEE